MGHWGRISTFNILDQATNIVYRKSATVLANFDYLYNTVGMITQKVAKIGSSTTTNRYSYDDLDRLVSESISGAVTSTATFAYDLVGNRTNMVLNAVTNKYTFSNGCDRLVSWGTNNESTASYSPAGCVTGLFYAATNKLYLTWNSEYQLTSVATGTTSAVVERNAYDALGRRASSWGWDGATTTNFFLYDGANLAADVDSTGGMRRAYAYGPGIDNILSMTVYTGTTVKTYFYLKDHLGTVHAVTDSTGTNIVERYVYDAWGKVLDVRNGSGTKLTTTAIGNRWLWQGREYSWRTGLYFFRSRWADPVTGRWLSNDPIGISGGLDQYTFCGNNPVMFRDPSGLTGEYKNYDDAVNAALDEAFRITSASKKTAPHKPKGVESGAIIHKKDGKFTFSMVAGSRQTINGVEMSHLDFPAKLPTTAVAVVHSHTESEVFSRPGQKTLFNDTDTADAYKRPIYLITPSKQKKVYYPKTVQPDPTLHPEGVKPGETYHYDTMGPYGEPCDDL